MFFIRFLLRLVGMAPKKLSAAEIRKMQIMERNRKLHIIMNAVRTQQTQAARAEAKSQNPNVVPDKNQAQAQTAGESMKKGAQEHDQLSAIGKSKGGKAAWRQRTGKSRTVRKRVRRRRERSLTLWR